MHFGVNSLIWTPVDPVSGTRPTEHERVKQALNLAVLAEDFGYDFVSFGEHHYGEFAGSSPFVCLAAVAARTKRVKLLTAVVAMSWLNAVRVAEDIGTLDQLSRGRVGIITARGANPRSNEVLGVDGTRTAELQDENYRLLNKLLYETNVDWKSTAHNDLTNVTSIPRPYQERIQFWHGTSQNKQLIDTAIEYGDGIFIPLFFSQGSTVADVQRQYPMLADYYFAKWEERWGSRDGASVGIQTTAYVRRRSQDAWNEFRPYYDGQRIPGAPKDSWQAPLDDAVEAGILLCGSPEEVLDQLGRLHERVGHSIHMLSYENRGELFGVQVECLQLFAETVMPFARERFPSSLWDGPIVPREPYFAPDSDLVDGHVRGA